MKIKNFMDLVNKGSDNSENKPSATDAVNQNDSTLDDEKVIYIENARLETASEQADSKQLIAGRTQWADRSMGEILVDLGNLQSEDVDRIIEYQRAQGKYFGEAATELKLVSQEHILQALSIQFGYTYDPNETELPKEMVMAHSPFGEQAEEFRAIRSRLMSSWLTSDRKTLAVVSPESKDGRSYVAANLALVFAQLGRPTLLIDANLREPRQHEIFKISHKVGLSMLLAGRVTMKEMDALPDQVSTFQHLSILGCGPVPPNPAELLSGDVLGRILRKLEKYYDAIIIDTPPAKYQADVASIATGAGSTLVVAREQKSRLADTKELLSVLEQAKVSVVGAVLNRY